MGGISSQVRPSRRRPLRLLKTPPHCFKRKATLRRLVKMSCVNRSAGLALIDLEVSSNPALGAWHPHLTEQVLWIGGAQAAHGRLAGLERGHFRRGPFTKRTRVGD